MEDYKLFLDLTSKNMLSHNENKNKKKKKN